MPEKKDTTRLGRLLMELAVRFGFGPAGVLDWECVPGELAPHVRRFDEWLGAGFQGERQYLVRGRDRRADPRKVFPEVRGIFCVAAPHGTHGGNESADDPASGARFARYLRGRDYHAVMVERLESLLREAAERIPFGWKVFCDTSAVLERALANLAGLGWIGKNGCLIHPEFGSYLFLAGAFLDVSPGGSPKPPADRCGTCERCIEACPTGAFPAPRLLDARRCIAYRTLEKRGGWTPSEEDLRRLKNRVAGCDACQEVCPFNRGREPKVFPEFDDAVADATRLFSWEELLAETGEDYRRRVSASALAWVKPENFRRNVAFALAASSETMPKERLSALFPLVCECGEREPDAGAKAAWEVCRDAFQRALNSL